MQEIKEKKQSEMRLLVSDSRCKQQRQPSEKDNHRRTLSMSVATTRIGHRNVGDSILSDDLRDQFEVMKRISRHAQRRSDNDGSGIDDDDRHSETGDKNSDTPELKHKVREAAIETAIKVDNEINQWRDEIANLEALLLAEEEKDEKLSSSAEGVPYNNEVELGITEIAFVVQNHSSNDDEEEEHC